MVLAADGRSVAPFGARFSRRTEPAAEAAEEAEADKIKRKTKPKVKTPPVSAEKRRRASPL